MFHSTFYINGHCVSMLVVFISFYLSNSEWADYYISQVMDALPTVELDPPTISMTFGVNDSPLAGRDGSHVRGLGFYSFS